MRDVGEADGREILPHFPSSRFTKQDVSSLIGILRVETVFGFLVRLVSEKSFRRFISIRVMGLFMFTLMRLSVIVFFLLLSFLLFRRFLHFAAFLSLLEGNAVRRVRFAAAAAAAGAASSAAITTATAATASIVAAFHRRFQSGDRRRRWNNSWHRFRFGLKWRGGRGSGGGWGDCLLIRGMRFGFFNGFLFTQRQIRF